MADHQDEPGTGSATQGSPDSQHSPAPASPKVAPFDEAALMRKMLLSVPEVAFLMRVGVRTVWRLMADPKSKFPKPRHFRGRTLLPRDEVIAFLEGESR